MPAINEETVKTVKRLFEQMSIAEVARITGLKETNVKNILLNDPSPIYRRQAREKIKAE